MPFDLSKTLDSVKTVHNLGLVRIFWALCKMNEFKKSKK